MSQPYWSAPQNLPHTFRCSNHPEREGVGICVSCRSVVCVECSTKIDRMNYCIRCLQAAAPDRNADTPNPVREAVLGVPLLLLSFAGTAGVFAALGFVLSLLRR
ncbi:MAG: hypothetical protein K0Q72_1753 [Armatimonadetes bacterium]|jgi:hypothetical protein|nr:hypothetical protein [Armatimonadota bacterium]